MGHRAEKQQEGGFLLCYDIINLSTYQLEEPVSLLLLLGDLWGLSASNQAVTAPSMQALEVGSSDLGRFHFFP